jgi:histone acetyltransferase MYST1
MFQDVSELAPIDQHLEKEHQEKTKVKNIQVVELGKYEVQQD